MWPPTADLGSGLLLAGEPQRQSTDSCAGVDGHGMHAHTASWFARLPARLQSNMISVNVKVGSGPLAGGALAHKYCYRRFFEMAARRAARTACCGRAESVRPTPVSKPLLQKNSSFKPEKKIDSTFADLYIAPLNF